jgi:hypothetical protein
MPDASAAAADTLRHLRPTIGVRRSARLVMQIVELRDDV